MDNLEENKEVNEETLKEDLNSVSALVKEIEETIEQNKGKPVPIPEASSDIDVGRVLTLISSMQGETEALDDKNVVEYLTYLLCGGERPAWAEKVLSDGDNRVKEYQLIMILRSMETLPKVQVSSSILLDSIIKDLPKLKYMTISEKMEILEKLNKYKTDILNTSQNYYKLSKDVQSLPLVYRQLLDELFKVPTSKISRLKLLPKIIDLPDEQWERILEITNIK